MFAYGVTIIGGGEWGLALAAAAARVGTPTYLHSRRAGAAGAIGLPPGVTLLADFDAVAARSRLIVLAVPSTVATEVARSLGDSIDGRHYVVHGVRGLVGDALETLSDVVRRETPARRLGALGGPVLAEELLAGLPSVLVAGSPFPEVTRAVAESFEGPALRVATTTDLRGVEWASALMGCAAIGIGYARGAGLKPGLLAALVSRAIEEAARIAKAAGGDETTIQGLAGMGDLLASITQEGRPEVALGQALARGATAEQAIQDARLRVEAVQLLPRVASWAAAARVDAPLLRALAHAVDGSPSSIRGGVRGDALVRELMGTAQRG